MTAPLADRAVAVVESYPWSDPRSVGVVAPWLHDTACVMSGLAEIGVANNHRTIGGHGGGDGFRAAFEHAQIGRGGRAVGPGDGLSVVVIE